MLESQVVQKRFEIVIGNDGLGELSDAGYVGTICFVTGADAEGYASAGVDLHVTRDQLEQLRDRIVAHLEYLDEVLRAR